MGLAGKVTTALAILAVFSMASIAVTTMNYTQGVAAVRSVQLGTDKVELRDEGSPEVVVSFHLRNGSGISVRLEALDLYLYLNGHFMGTNYAPFAKIALDGFEETTMEFAMPITYLNRQFVERARQEEGFSWFVRGRAKLVLPYREREIWLYVREHWTES